ncbi:MAG: hypothetical protein ABSE77_22700 [Acidimicrobiales bacterium]|jgi:hypothetical protein
MTTITLKIEGPPGRVPADALATVLNQSLKILKDLARREIVTWYVTDLKIDSAMAALSADDQTDTPLRLATELVQGVRAVESGEGLPAFFSDASLYGLKQLAKPLGTEGARYLDVSVGQNGTRETARATNRTVDNLAILRTARSRALGSITGVLDTISLRGPRGKFEVVDPVSRRPVTCAFQTAQEETVKGTLRKRVVVRGTVVRNAKGQPIRIEDATFEVLKPSPPLVTLVGIDPEFTGGEPTGPYMERICS